MANLSGAVRHNFHVTGAAELKLLPEEYEFPPLQVPKLKKVLPTGLKRGAITEIHGQRSSGRISLCLHLLALATAHGEICALVDFADSFHPASAAAAGVQLDHVVWVRCSGNMEHALRANDLLLHAGGFGVILLDLCEAKSRILNRIPLSYWFRFRRAIEHTPTMLLVCAETRLVNLSAAYNLEIKSKVITWLGSKAFNRLTGLETQARAGKIVRAQQLFLKTVA